MNRKGNLGNDAFIWIAFMFAILMAMVITVLYGVQALSQGFGDAWDTVPGLESGATTTLNPSARLVPAAGMRDGANLPHLLMEYNRSGQGTQQEITLDLYCVFTAGCSLDPVQSTFESRATTVLPSERWDMVLEYSSDVRVTASGGSGSFESGTLTFIYQLPVPGGEDINFQVTVNGQGAGFQW